MARGALCPTAAAAICCGLRVESCGQCAAARDLLAAVRDRLRWPCVIAGGAGLLALLVAALEVSNWDIILQFFYHVPYGADDPLFNKDISFYLFVLPAYILVKNWMLLTLVLSALFAAAIYWVHGDIEYDVHRRSISRLPPVTAALSS